MPCLIIILPSYLHVKVTASYNTTGKKHFPVTWMKHYTFRTEFQKGQVQYQIVVWALPYNYLLIFVDPLSWDLKHHFLIWKNAVKDCNQDHKESLCSTAQPAMKWKVISPKRLSTEFTDTGIQLFLCMKVLSHELGKSNFKPDLNSVGFWKRSYHVGKSAGHTLTWALEHQHKLNTQNLDRGSFVNINLSNFSK